LDLIVESKIGKKYTIYLPKAVVEATGLEEGEKILLKVKEKTVIVEPVLDPLKLAIKGEKYASIDPEIIEDISIEEQGRQVTDSA
jgi:AbrB family looped-hinge helix DNA binding protein